MNAKTGILCNNGLSWGPSGGPRWAGGWALRKPRRECLSIAVLLRSVKVVERLVNV
jgi:hypothetical protein